MCVSDLFGKGARLNGGSDPAVSEPKTTASLDIIQSWSGVPLVSRKRLNLKE